MKPPTISEDEEAEAAAEAGHDVSGAEAQHASTNLTVDKEVAGWVQAALEKKRQGKMTFAKKPALHEAPLDAVPGSPLMGRDEAPAVLDGQSEHEIKPNPGVRVGSPELQKAHVESVDFASNIAVPEDDQ
jgi:hypothetical protein